MLDRTRYPAVEAAVALLAACHASDPAKFAWRNPPYEYEHTKLPIDILAGASALREHIEAGRTAREIAGTWEPGVAEFAKLRERYLLY